MYIVIGADLVPTESNVREFTSGEMCKIISNNVESFLKDANYRIFNLEVPLTDNQTPIKKCGPNLQAPCSSINGYKALGADLLTIANNHILDQGEQGFNSTIALLENNGIKTVGGGENSTKASEPFVFMFGDRKIGVYACSEHEFSIATETSPGANPYDPLYSFDDVEKLKSITDYVIVLYHGGKEHYRYPSPQLQKICRRFAEKGADLVLCQHSHCIGCMEVYADSTIVYGQGNFLFDRSDSEYWKTSLLVKLDDELKVSFIPLVKVDNGVSIANEEESSKIISDFQRRSNEIQNDPGIVRCKYDEFALQMADYYLGSFKGKEGLVFRVANKLTGNRLRKHIIKKKYTRDEILHLVNYLSCEAHSELAVRGLELKSYE